MPRIDLIQIRRGTAAEWAAADPVLAAGELGFVSDAYEIMVGNGVGIWSGLAAIGGGGGGGDVATDAIWNVAGDTVYATGNNAAVRLGIGAALSVYCVNSGATAPEWVASSGTGNVARVASPTFTTPALGTPSALVLTNATGLPNAAVIGLGSAALVATSAFDAAGSAAAAQAASQPLDADLTTWAGVTPGTGVAAALAVAVGSAGAVLVNGGVLGTPSSGAGTNLTGTAAGLTAGNATLAVSATAALGLKSATTTVAVDAATAPSTGQVLTATSSTAANWQTPAGGGGSGTVTNTGGNLTSNAIVLGAGTVDTKVVAGIVTDGTSVITLGVNTTTIGKLKMFGNTSGDATLQPAAVAGTATVLTLPSTTGTLARLPDISTTAPSSPVVGQLWFDSTYGKLKIYYNDGTTSQWVDAFNL